MGLTENKLQSCVFRMREHVTMCKGVAHFGSSIVDLPDTEHVGHKI